MQKRTPQRFVALFLSLCFMLGTLGTTYHVCDTQPSFPQELASANMDCHSDAAEAGTSQKKCCIDLSCPKCFSSTVNIIASDSTVGRSVPESLSAAHSDNLVSLHPGVAERPPKNA